MSERLPPVSVAEYEERAREVLPRQAFDYYAGGAGDEWTLSENRAAFAGFVLRPRVLVDVTERDTSTTVLGQVVALPVLIAPTALHGMAHEEGEVATARGAAAVGTVMILSTLASRSIEDVAEAGSARWFQLYVQRDHDLTAELVKRAHAAGYGAIVLTVDLPVVGSRDRDTRNSFTIPEGMGYVNLGIERPPEAAGSDFAAYVAFLSDQAVTWDDLAWIRSLSPLPLVIKGILTAEDARLAAEHGADAVVVSNHGGRQLDGSIPSVEALPEVVEAVGGRAEVFLDGGVRRGSHVLKALALGARAVLIGRPAIWGLAVDGERGVARILELLRAELDVAMALAGCRTVGEITPDLVRRRGPG